MDYEQLASAGIGSREGMGNHVVCAEMHVRVASEYMRTVLEGMRGASAREYSECLGIMERAYINLEEAMVGLERTNNFLEKVGMRTGKIGNGSTG